LPKTFSTEAGVVCELHEDPEGARFALDEGPPRWEAPGGEVETTQVALKLAHERSDD
jgi:hypothetical protein